jgi:hypothetical protein
MGTYLPLLSVEAGHGYFSDGACRDLELQPTAASAARLAHCGCLLRPLPGGLAVACDGDSLDALRLQAADPDDPFCVDLLARSHDPLFANYTEAPPPDGTAGVMLFDSAGAVAEGPDQWRLHAQPSVAPDDRVPLDAPVLAQMLTPRQRRLPPRFAVRIRIRPEDLQDLPPRAKRYVLRFQARATVWKYYLVGDWAQDQLSVVDLGREAEFEPAQPDRLADGRAALAVRSQARIALHERPAQRFQLRGRSNGGTERVLIKRLPVAGARQLSMESIRGVPTPVSEIFVHR